MILLLLIAKIFVASGIMFGYYWFFLRNKKFHHYNRFYLLASIAVPLIIPFIKIPVIMEPGNKASEALYQTVTVLTVDLQMTSLPQANPSEIYPTWQVASFVAYFLISVLLLFIIVKTILYIRSLRKKYPYEIIDDLKIYDTSEPGTPFSFFHSIFWNQQLNLKSREGNQVFRHEFFHVQQKHSLDIIFAELATAVFWLNPFFHLIKKEIKAIHEFLADQYAVQDADRSDYASLLVQQLLESKSLSISHYFFQNHIKRRIAMITQLKNKKYGYWSRLMVLPITIILFCGIALYAKSPQQNKTQVNPKQPSTVNSKSDTIPPELKKKLEAEYKELQTKKIELQKAHEKQMEEMVQQQKMLLEKLGAEKELEKDLLELKRQLMIEQKMVEKNKASGQYEKIKMEEMEKLKKKLKLEQNDMDKEKLMELQKLKQQLETSQELHLQEENNLQDKMKLLNEYQQKNLSQDILEKKMMNELLNKTSQYKLQEQQRKQLNDAQFKLLLKQNQSALVARDKLEKQKINEILNKTQQYKLQELQKKQIDEMQLKMLLKQKELELSANKMDAQQLLLKRQIELQDQKRTLFIADSLRMQITRHYMRNLRYPQALIDANKEGFVYVSLELDDKGILKDYVIHNGEPFTDGRKIYEIVVVSLASNKTAAPSGETDFQALFNAEVEKVTKKYAPGSTGVPRVPEKIFLKIIFTLEK